MKRRDDDERGLTFWILVMVFLFGGIGLIAHGEANTDAGAELCPRSSHYCIGVYE